MTATLEEQLRKLVVDYRRSRLHFGAFRAYHRLARFVAKNGIDLVTDLIAARAELTEARAEIERLRETLEACEDYFAGRADADQPSGVAVPIPNEEMQLLMLILPALKK